MKTVKFIVILLTTVILFSGCHKEDKKVSIPSSEAVSSVEEEEIVEVKEPEKIVSLSPALTEIVYELGGTIEGRSEYCDYPIEVQALTSCGNAEAPDIKALKKLQPTIVLSSIQLSDDIIKALDGIGAKAIVFPRAKNLDELEQIYISLAALLDNEENGKVVFTKLKEKYDALPKASGELSGIWLRATPLIMATGDTLESKWLEALGIKNDAAEFTNWQYPPDKAIDLYPDIIFYDESIPIEYFKNTTIYNTTDAYKQNRIYPFSALVFERQSGRMFDELERMSNCIK